MEALNKILEGKVTEQEFYIFSFTKKLICNVLGAAPRYEFECEIHKQLLAISQGDLTLMNTPADYVAMQVDTLDEEQAEMVDILQQLISQEMARDILIATDLVDYMLGNQ